MQEPLWVRRTYDLWAYRAHDRKPDFIGACKMGSFCSLFWATSRFYSRPRCSFFELRLGFQHILFRLASLITVESNHEPYNLRLIDNSQNFNHNAFSAVFGGRKSRPRWSGTDCGLDCDIHDYCNSSGILEAVRDSKHGLGWRDDSRRCSKNSFIDTIF